MGIVDLVRMGIAPEVSQLSQGPRAASAATSPPGVGSGELAIAIPATFATDPPNSSKNSNCSSGKAHEIEAQGTSERSLEDRIRAMAKRWQCTPEELADRVPSCDEETDPGRAYVAAKLRSNPGLRRAIYTGQVRDGAVIVTVGVRYGGGIAVGDIQIPAERYDPFRLLELIEHFS